MFGALERFGKEVQRGIYHAHFYNAIVVIQIHTLCGDLLARADMECPRHRTEKGGEGRMGCSYITCKRSQLLVVNFHIVARVNIFCFHCLFALWFV